MAFSSIQHTSWCLRVLFVKINLTTNLRNNIKIRTKVYRLFPDAVLSKDLGINWHLYPFHKCRGFLKLSGRCKTIPQWVCTAAQKNKSDTITYFLNSIQNTITEKGMHFQTASHPWKKVNSTVWDKLKWQLNESHDALSDSLCSMKLHQGP